MKPYLGAATASLRAINTALWVLCFYTLHAILQQQQHQHQHQQPPPCSSGDKAQQQVAERSEPDQVQGRQQHSLSSACDSSSLTSLVSHLRSPSSPCLWAATLSFFPLHWFYSVLFYTDVGAHLFLLACLLLSMQQRFGFAAAAGAAAVMFRQTNAVWVAFILGAAVLRIARDCQVQQHACGPQEQPGVQGNSLNTASADQTEPRPHRQSDKRNQQQEQQQEQEQEQGSDAAGVAGVLSTVEAVWRFRGRILFLLWPLSLVPAAFAAFLVVNKVGEHVLGRTRWAC
ncbi:DIE2/ALG10 family-domain-containing protein [Dunaliella salina]|uniref:Dol-P-Glc:Glc(2)Man(9)GlcNAc(2)-PP-Dol alpha-1,2-glucosyltransferase n=1 Tax=Dunaliella salina TaxID=3046 RepID=A0ABQ7GDE5_DUNSA|nr:DIE2/ALG10 family-domain-containing protein [Dunaliella salina]|eukprot:KAF5832620.1 DIE2/ALG10 family-domain-containing protein [Dunaliella salina]